MNAADFEFLSAFLKTRSGLHFTDDQGHLLESRLEPVARRLGKGDLSSLVASLRRSPEALAQDVIEAMTNNESMFFRDLKPFDQLRTIVLPKFRQSRKSIRLWSAGCSNGQEAYSIAMTLLEGGAGEAGSFEIVATDIDRQVLKKARDGRYTQFEAQRGMPVALLLKYFTQVDGMQWQIDDKVKRRVCFHPHNLLDAPDHLGWFDVIFCRNVLIYFDEATKRSIFSHLAGRLGPGGMLFLGAAESASVRLPGIAPVEGERGLLERIA